MPVRIPTDASAQLREALLEIERRLHALEAPPTIVVPTAADTADLDARLKTVERGPVFGVEWLEMVASGPQHARGLTPDTDIAAGLGHERALHADGTWRRPIDGLVQAVPVGVGRPANATRVVEVLADLAIAGGIGATDAFLKSLVVQGAITAATAALVSLAISGGLTVGGLLSAPLVGARAYNSANISIGAGGNPTLMTLNSENWDTHGFHVTTGNTARLTVPTGCAGYYRITGSIRFAATATQTYRGILICINTAGTYDDTKLVAQTFWLKGASNQVQDGVAVATVYLAEGEYVEMFGYSGEATTASAHDTYYDDPSLELYRIGV